uniref:Knot1 domain-containing protein n=1 Tax=Globodera pallida TaxID=36090 RepID=A0A183BVR4_GLOPA
MKSPILLLFPLFLFLLSEVRQSDSAKSEVEKVCRHGDPPNNFGFGLGCELVLSFLCNMHCTSGRLKEQGYSSGVCRLFDVNCYCQC